MAKVLATKFGAVMDNLISSNQLVFLKERMLVDEVMVVNEVIDLAKKY